MAGIGWGADLDIGIFYDRLTPLTKHLVMWGGGGLAIFNLKNRKVKSMIKKFAKFPGIGLTTAPSNKGLNRYGFLFDADNGEKHVLR